MTKKFWLLAFAPCALALGLGLGACKSDDDDDDDDGGTSTLSSAIAEVKDKGGAKLGTATFTKDGDKVKLVIELTGVATKGAEVGIHIHQTATCDADNGFKGAGDHWNPGRMPGDYNGKPDTGYLGELGKIAIDADGKARQEWSYSSWSIGGNGDNNVIGRAIILHDIDTTPDDGMPAPRQGCGEVAVKK
jgi:superoxide dismutase, Cu-Zn family